MEHSPTRDTEAFNRRLPDDNWRYHLTTKPVAERIKSVGMSSQVVRIGRPVASPTGAFAVNKSNHLEQKIDEKIIAYLAKVLVCGGTREAIINAPDNYIPFAFDPLGSNELDVPRLVKIEEDVLQRFSNAIGARQTTSTPLARKVARDQATQFAQGFQKQRRTHTITRLASQCVAYQYKIEETITSSHIYFFLPKYAEICYSDYMKNLAGAEAVVLRVNISHLPGLMPDDSEFRAVMTRATVAASNIQFIAEHTSFPQLSYRRDDNNWAPLTQY